MTLHHFRVLLSIFHSSFLFATAGMVAEDSNYYPERLGRMIVINAPTMFSWAWRIMSGFLNVNQRLKMSMYGCDPSEWRPVILGLIDESQVPIEYGGNCSKTFNAMKCIYPYDLFTNLLLLYSFLFLSPAVIL